jgi:hypothetical protein
MACMDPDGVAAQSQSYSRIMDDYSVDLPGHGQQQGIPHSASYSNGPMTPAFYAQKPQMFHPSQQPHPQQQPQQPTTQAYIPQGQIMIPPTPNSIELHGNAATYPQRVGDNSDMYDRYSRMIDEQVCRFSTVDLALSLDWSP